MSTAFKQKGLLKNFCSAEIYRILPVTNCICDMAGNLILVSLILWCLASFLRSSSSVIYTQKVLLNNFLLSNVQDIPVTNSTCDKALSGGNLSGKPILFFHSSYSVIYMKFSRNYCLTIFRN